MPRSTILFALVVSQACFPGLSHAQVSQYSKTDAAGSAALSCSAPAPASAPAACVAPVAVPVVPAKPMTLSALFGDSPQAQLLEHSLRPYETAMAPNGSAPLQRLEGGVEGESAFRFGANFIVLPPPPSKQYVDVALPDGVWVNYWTGAQVLGGQTVSLEVLDAYPMWARGGAVIPMQPAGHAGGTPKTEAACAATCLFEVLPGYTAASGRVEKDPNGRILMRDDHSLTIEGADTHAVVRWRFTEVLNARVNGVRVAVESSPEGYYATFDHTGTSTVEWTTRYAPASRRK